MKKIAITIAALFMATLSFGQTIEKSQAEMIYDTIPSVAPCTYCSEMIFVMADTSEYRWDGDSWELWDNGVRWSLEQDSIRVGYKFGIEYARDTIRTPGSGGGGGGTVNAVVAGDNVSVDNTDPANPIVSAPTFPAEDVILADIEDNFGTDNVEFAIGDLFTRVVALINAMGIPDYALNFGNFTSPLLTDNSSAKSLFEEIAGEIEANQDSITALRTDIGAGATNLSYTASPTDGTVTSDTGTDATIPAGSTTNASLMLPADKTKLDGIEAGATADQNSSEVELSAPITGLPASTDVHEALTELATNATVADQLIGDLITLSGVPITSQDFGTFTGTTLSDNEDAKALYQEIETALEVKMDSFTLVRAADTSYYVFTQYNTSSGAFQVDTLWQRTVSGDPVDVVDGTTITGAGTVGDPFKVDSDLVNKQIGDYEADAAGTYVKTEKVLAGVGTGVFVINTGITLTANTNGELIFDIHWQSNVTEERVSTSMNISFKYTHSTTSIERATAFLEGRVPWLTNIVRLGIFDGTIHVFISDELETRDAYFRLKHFYFQGSSNYTFDYAALNIARISNLTTGGFTGLHTATYENSGLIPGASVKYSTEGYFASLVHYNETNSSSAGADDVGVYEYYLPGSNNSYNEGSPNNTLGVRVGAELKPYPGSTNIAHYTIGQGAHTHLRITGLNKFLFNEGVTAREPVLTYEFVGTDGMVLPYGTTAQRGIGALGTFRWNTTTGAWDAHNGVSFGRLYPHSDTSPADGQVPVFNSTTGLYDPTTLSIGTMSSFNLESDDYTLRSIGDGDDVSLLGENGIISRDGVVPGEVFYGLDLESIPNSVTLDGDESFLFFDDLDALESKTDIDIIKGYINTGVVTVGTSTTNRPLMWPSSGSAAESFPMEVTGSTTRFTQQTSVQIPTGATAFAGAPADGSMRYDSDTDQFKLRIAGVYEDAATEDYVDTAVEDAEPDVAYTEDTDLAIFPDKTVEFVTLNTTSSAVSDTNLSLPTASSSYGGFQIVVWSIDSSGSFGNTVSASTIQNGVSTGSSISLSNFQSTTISCIQINSSGSYRWVVTNQY